MLPENVLINYIKWHHFFGFSTQPFEVRQTNFHKGWLIFGYYKIIVNLHLCV